MDDTPEPEKASRWVTRSSVRGRRGPKTAVLKSTSQDATAVTLAEAASPLFQVHESVAETGSGGREDASVLSVIGGDAVTVGRNHEEEDLELQLKKVQIKRQLLRLRKRKREDSGAEG
ncbi:hypothetical protein LTR56_008675 [Elasticomyces elasticus]|nr:hypothetical protein LTR22_022509 [Elasticomyces elasticus]KAK3646324.1 hypothetical protein LTR56_008675 [Elasticomyces elasticus]KAK4911485.1 hypothetical protein LTR49_019980 [Elasticomyces elasticus]KAK5768044.1 hypothetical protein LTS12_001861 [Elasticomyces elasticus]